MATIEHLARAIAVAFTAGPWSPDGMAERAQSVLSPYKKRRWVGNLATRAFTAFPFVPPLPCCREIARFIQSDRGFHAALLREFGPLDGYPDVALYKLPLPGMWPTDRVPNAERLHPLTTTADVASWLHVTFGELDWFADRHGRERFRGAEALRHYRYRWVGKRRGGLRLLEMPKQRLKEIQRRVLHEILDCIPPHSAAHAFCAGRSLKTFLQPHVGKRLVVHIDLRNFFPSIRFSRIHALFRALGYPENVAGVLAGLCTNQVPDFVTDEAKELFTFQEAKVLQQAHLPQGSPASPALANLCAYRLDCRLSGLAAKVGGSYTRYADDLLFSGGRRLERSLHGFIVMVGAIAIDDGFRIRQWKTEVMRRSQRQRVAGVVLNQQLNTPRHEYDKLRAILYNCVRIGAASQNRDGHTDFKAHLQGRIGYIAMLNPQRGKRLRALFEQIEWNDT